MPGLFYLRHCDSIVCAFDESELDLERFDVCSIDGLDAADRHLFPQRAIDEDHIPAEGADAPIFVAVDNANGDLTPDIDGWRYQNNVITPVAWPVDDQVLIVKNVKVAHATIDDAIGWQSNARPAAG